MKAEEIVDRICAAYPDAKVTPDGADCNFSVTVVSEAFDGLSPIQRQRPILALFKDDISSGALHALSIVAKTPGEV
ncbi:MAG: BolA family protein [Gammaproteobacteria bacterium]|nr:BolA family protein [Gammaproteobacteria bacterium]